MNWLHRLCLGRPCRVIESGGKPYLVRIYLAHWRGWRVYLHRFVTSDGERWLHDHPFTGCALVLAGGYWEEVLPALGGMKRLYRRRWLNWIPGRKFHRIAAVRPGTWTLFVHGPHSKVWGFLEPVETEDCTPAMMYFNPYDQSDSNGAHWWARHDAALYPPRGVA